MARLIRQAIRPWHRLVTSMLFIGFLPSCVSWQVQGPTPDAAIRDLGPSTVRVTRTDGNKLMLFNAAMSGDSIVGDAAKTGPRVGIPLADVTKVETGHTDALKTAGMAFGTAGLAVLILGLVYLASYEDQS